MGLTIDAVKYFAKMSQVTYPECEIHIHISPATRDLIYQEVEDDPVAQQLYTDEEKEKYQEALKYGGFIGGYKTFVVLGIEKYGFRIVPILRNHAE